MRRKRRGSVKHETQPRALLDLLHITVPSHLKGPKDCPEMDLTRISLCGLLLRRNRHPCQTQSRMRILQRLPTIAGAQAILTGPMVPIHMEAMFRRCLKQQKSRNKHLRTSLPSLRPMKDRKEAIMNHNMVMSPLRMTPDGGQRAMVVKKARRMVVVPATVKHRHSHRSPKDTVLLSRKDSCHPWASATLRI